MDLITAFMLHHEQRWVPATAFARISKISRKTIANWCKDQRKFAKRLGRIWYIDLDQLGLTEEQIETIILASRANPSTDPIE